MKSSKLFDGTLDIYSKAELNACKLLNSNKVPHKWKRDFKKEYRNDDWDIINSNKIKIEVKSNRFRGEFGRTRCSLNTKNQHKYLIMKLFIDDFGDIKEYKFVRKIEGKWVNITDTILCKK